MSGLDVDILDMEGDWAVTQAIPGFTWNYTVRLTNIGPNSYGGHSFKGINPDAPSWGPFYGDTFYGAVGVQLMQMRYEEEMTTGGRYYKLLCGRHLRGTSLPTVEGGWVNVGSPGAGAGGYAGTFVMVWLRRRP